jgi:hypothetical protein
MDVYWSIDVCGWVRCPAPPDALATPWARDEPQPQRLEPVPEQRTGQTAPAPA